MVHEDFGPRNPPSTPTIFRRGPRRKGQDDLPRAFEALAISRQGDRVLATLGDRSLARTISEGEPLSIQVDCGSCGGRFQTKDEHAGKRARCPGCGEAVTVPAAEQASLDELSPGTTDSELATADLGEIDGFGGTSQPPPADAMPPTALAVAAFAALVGAVAWAVILWVTEHEIGWISAGIGGLVGVSAARVGGRGPMMGIMCAVFALVSIFGGKLLGSYLLARDALEDVVVEYTTETLYRELQRDAQDFLALDPEPELEVLQEYLVAHEYTGIPDPAAVPTADVEEFLASQAPFLRTFEATYPTYDSWKDTSAAGVQEALWSDFSALEVTLADLSSYDLLWAFLGITTAYGMVPLRRRGGREPGSPRPTSQ